MANIPNESFLGPKTPEKIAENFLSKEVTDAVVADFRKLLMGEGFGEKLEAHIKELDDPQRQAVLSTTLENLASFEGRIGELHATTKGRLSSLMGELGIPKTETISA